MQLYQKYKTEKKRVKDRLYEAKKTHLHNKFTQSKGNSAQMWHNIREIIPDKKSCNNVITDNIQDKAEEFNNFFANVGRKTFEKCKNNLNSNINISDNPRVINETDNNAFRLEPIDVETVILTISRLKETESVGSDGISLRFLKDSLFITAYYLTCIFNTSIVTGNISHTLETLLSRYVKEAMRISPQITDPCHYYL